MDNTWFFISDTTVLRQIKFQCNSGDVSVPYILIYERRNNLLMPLSSLLNDTAGILSSDSTPDIMMWQSIIKELEKQKTKIAIAQEQDITISDVKSPVKRKSKFTSRKFTRENGKNRKRFMCHNLNDDKREQLKENEKIRKKQMRDNLDDNKKGELKKVDNKRKKEKRDNLDTNKKEFLKDYEKKEKRKIRDNLEDDKREQIKESDKIRKKQMCDNLDDNKKGELKNIDNKRKKENRDNLDILEKKLLKNYEKKERENCAIILMARKENR